LLTYEASYFNQRQNPAGLATAMSPSFASSAVENEGQFTAFKLFASIAAILGIAASSLGAFALLECRRKQKAKLAASIGRITTQNKRMVRYWFSENNNRGRV